MGKINFFPIVSPMTETKLSHPGWNVYVVRCSDGSLYTGIARCIEKRIDEHNSKATGAKYTRQRRPVKLVYSESYDSRSLASKREAAIKNMKKQEKELLISKQKGN